MLCRHKCSNEMGNIEFPNNKHKPRYLGTKEPTILCASK